MTAPDDVALIGFAELSATVVRARLLAVRDDRRRTGLARRLVQAFDELGLATGARVAQAVTRPGNSAAVAFHTALGASAYPVRDRAGPGEDRLVLTRSLTR